MAFIYHALAEKWQVLQFVWGADGLFASPHVGKMSFEPFTGPSHLTPVIRPAKMDAP